MVSTPQRAINLTILRGINSGKSFFVSSDCKITDCKICLEILENICKTTYNIFVLVRIIKICRNKPF